MPTSVGATYYTGYGGTSSGVGNGSTTFTTTESNEIVVVLLGAWGSIPSATAVTIDGVVITQRVTASNSNGGTQQALYDYAVPTPGTHTLAWNFSVSYGIGFVNMMTIKGSSFIATDYRGSTGSSLTFASIPNGLAVVGLMRNSSTAPTPTGTPNSYVPITSGVGGNQNSMHFGYALTTSASETLSTANDSYSSAVGAAYGPDPVGSKMIATSSLFAPPAIEVLAGTTFAVDALLADYAFVPPVTMSAESSMDSSGYSIVSLSSSVQQEIVIPPADLTVVAPSPVTLSGSISAEIAVLGALSLYVPPPPVTPLPPPPPPPPPVPPPAYINDGGTIPLKPAGRVLVSIFKSDGTTLIANVPFRKDVQWLNEMNAPGTGTFKIHLDDDIFDAHPDLLDQFNIVKFTFQGVKVKAWVIEDVAPVRTSTGEIADRWVNVTGRGVMAVLESAVVYPEYGLRENASESRHFDFASKDGPWRVPSEWVAPVGMAWSATNSKGGKTAPKDWPDPLARYIWSISPTTTAPVGRNWFRGKFTLAARTNVIIYSAADNAYTLYIDGDALAASADATSAAGLWTFETTNITLTAGDHTIAVAGDNIPGVGFNPAWILVSIFQTNASGAPTTVNFFRTSETSMLVKAYGDAPGWHAANILQQLVTEAQQRGVTALQPVTFGFTNSADTSGKTWTDRQDRVVNVGTTDLLDLTTQLIEVAFDLEIDPDMKMNAWIRRGLDFSETLRLLPGRDVVNAAATVRGGRIKNQALLKSGSGWIELSSPASKGDHGRREVGLSVGNAGSNDQLITVGSAAIQEVSRPETTIPLSYTSVRGPQPHVDYDLGDVLMVPSPFSGMQKARVMSIAGSEQETSIQWDVDFYPHNDVDVIDQVVVGVGANAADPDTLYQSEVLSDSPWGYWRLQETTGTKFADKSGNNRPLTITGGTPVLAQTGPVNKAVKFNTDQSYATAGSTKLFQQAIVTFEAWVYLTVYSAVPSPIIGMAVGGINGTSHDKEFVVESGYLRWYTTPAGAGDTLISTIKLNLNTWYHVACSVGPDGKKIYINGAVDTHNSVTTSYTTKAQQVMVRGAGDDFNGRTGMSIAEPAVYYQQLFDSRIASHYAAVTGGGGAAVFEMSSSVVYTGPTGGAMTTTNVNVGDMLLIFAKSRGGSIATPSGFTLVRSDTVGVETAYIYSKIAVAGDAPGASYSLDVGSSSHAIASLLVYSNATTVAAHAGATFSNSSADLEAPTITATTPGTLITTYGWGNNGTTGSAGNDTPDGMTERADANNGTQISGSVADQPVNSGVIGVRASTPATVPYVYGTAQAILIQ